MDYTYRLLAKGFTNPDWTGNKLPHLRNFEHNGIIEATDGKLHQIKYEIADVYGNTTSLSFKVQSKETKVIPVVHKGELFKYNKHNDVKDEGIRFSIP